MIQYTITIGNDPEDGQLGVSLAKRGGAVNNQERIAEDYFKTALEQVTAVFATALLEQGFISSAEAYTGAAGKREGDAFEGRVKG